jgi:hypothetical protein
VDAVMVSSGARAGSAQRARHLCAVPSSDEQLWEMTAAWLAAGLASNERVTYFDDGTVDAVLERLADDGVPVGEALTAGRLEIVPGATTRALLTGPPAHVRDAVRARIAGALAAGGTGWRMTGQLSHGLLGDADGGLAAFETALDEELAGRPARALCLYDRRRYPDYAIAELRGMHRRELTAPSIYDDGLLRVTRGGRARLRLAGQADHSNRGTIDRLVATLLSEALRSDGAVTDVVLDLASLRFIDVAGAVALTHGARAFPSTQRLVLDGVRPAVQRVLDRCAPAAGPRPAVVARSDPGSGDDARWERETRRAG